MADTGKNFRSVLVRLLTNQSLWLRHVALVADVIAADARFSEWLAVEGKRALSTEAFFDVLGSYEDATNKSRAAAVGFESSRDHLALEQVLVDTLRQLHSITGDQR